MSKCEDTCESYKTLGAGICTECRINNIKLEECDMCGQDCEPKYMNTTNDDRRVCDLCREDLNEEDK